MRGRPLCGHYDTGDDARKTTAWSLLHRSHSDCKTLSVVTPLASPVTHAADTDKHGQVQCVKHQRCKCARLCRVTLEMLVYA